MDSELLVSLCFSMVRVSDPPGRVSGATRIPGLPIKLLKLRTNVILRVGFDSYPERVWQFQIKFKGIRALASSLEQFL